MFCKKGLEKGTQNVESLLLDSRLITPVRFLKYDYKIVKCGDYVQLYFYEEKKVKSDLKNLDVNDLYYKKKSGNTGKKSSIISDRNIIRTKLNCQRLAKANADVWKSFITLTYSENMQDLKQAKKDLEYFVTNIKKIKSDFKYIAIPEFQKRGAIHFHLLSNLDLQDNHIIIKQKSNEKFFDVKYWNKGFTSFEPLEGDLKKIIGYISKYMTKECDDRLFGVRRFTSSQNLIKPIEEFVDIENDVNYKYLVKLLESKECIYENSYKDKFDNDVIFMEFKK